MNTQKAVALLLTLLPISIFAQGTAEDYRRAEQFLRPNVEKLAFKINVEPNWIGEAAKFWYKNDIREGKEFILVDCAENSPQPAFDHEKLAAAMSGILDKALNAQALPFDRVDFVNDGKAMRFDAEKLQWTCDLSTYACTTTKAVEEEDPMLEQISPDSNWVAFLKDHNLFVRSQATGEEIQLSHDGEENYDYSAEIPSPRRMAREGTMHVQPPVAAEWSPDSKKLVSFRLDQRSARRFTVVQSSPPDQLRPKTFTYAYSLPGEVGLSKAEPVIFDVVNRKRIPVDTEPIDLLYYRGPRFTWFKDSQRFHFRYNQRGYKMAQIKEVDARTGKTRELVEETADTQVDLYFRLQWLSENGDTVIWGSERDGWQHLYLYDGKTGQLKNQITKGPWVVREIIHADEKTKQVYFTASGREPDRDPYFRQVYRINFDGKGLRLLTPESADHDISMSPDGMFFVDNYSTVQTAPMSLLRRSSDGEVVRKLEEPDIEPLLQTGWKWPEPFAAKARDGKTDIYGLIWRPSTFDPSKSYPVVEQIYTGPHNFHVPKTFAAFRSTAQSIAELGFIVVQVDGLGTGRRSKAFGDFSYKNLGDGGIEDHIAWMEAAAERFPYMDLTRVGIYGHSAGGYDSAHAMLTHPEFYKVAVSSAGNHDHRMDKAVWVESWMGFPVEEHYVEQSNVTLAHNLEGKLLLVHGELDENVHPASTLQLVDALIKANKDFDMLILPNMHHGFGGHSYFTRKRWDYFVQHLHGVQPPQEFKINVGTDD